jgi:hypothetical protein
VRTCTRKPAAPSTESSPTTRTGEDVKSKCSAHQLGPLISAGSGSLGSSSCGAASMCGVCALDRKKKKRD